MEKKYFRLQMKQKGILKKIKGVGPFIMATPTYLKVKCGNKKCACAADSDKRHEKLHLSWSEGKGINGTLYVPVDLREEVLKWVKNYWKVKELMKDMTQISRQIIRIHSRMRGVIRQREIKKRMKGIRSAGKK